MHVQPPATGFGVNVSEIAETLIRKHTPEKRAVSVLVAFDEESFKEALEYSESTEGAVLSHICGEAENIEYAVKNSVKTLVTFTKGEKKIKDLK